MKVKAYIQSCAAISPQQSFGGAFAPAPGVLEEMNLLRAVEPDYRAYISPNNIRRMSRVLKMGLATALKTLQDAGIQVPDAIITGTGKGSLQDTERFLHDIRQYQEAALNPTPFIQSTYNSVNGLIALQQQCTRYNNTFVHRGFSFEHALLDGLLRLAEGEAQTALVGAFDEMTNEHFFIKSRIGYWKPALTQPADLLQSDTPGTIAGEGAAFFLLGKQPSAISVEGLRMLYKPERAQVGAALDALLSEHGITPADVHLVTGRNGDARYAHFYDEVEQHFAQVIPFKQFSGDYETAGAFALWMAHHTMQADASLQRVLIYNHFFGEQHAFILLQRH
ncbi:beta-ketoacyl synthase chain length factor [Chitinophaga lutea]